MEDARGRPLAPASRSSISSSASGIPGRGAALFVAGMKPPPEKSSPEPKPRGWGLVKALVPVDDLFAEVATQRLTLISENIRTAQGGKWLISPAANPRACGSVEQRTGNILDASAAAPRPAERRNARVATLEHEPRIVGRPASGADAGFYDGAR